MGTVGVKGKGGGGGGRYMAVRSGGLRSAVDRRYLEGRKVSR